MTRNHHCTPSTRQRGYVFRQNDRFRYHVDRESAFCAIYTSTRQIGPALKAAFSPCFCHVKNSLTVFHQGTEIVPLEVAKKISRKYSIYLDISSIFCNLTFENQRVMLPTQGEIQFSEHAVLYDKLVPKNHLLRQINDLIDFSFVYDELTSKYCLNNGRTAEDPVRMFKYLLLKTIYTLSDVDVVEHSRYDLSYKYFLGMMPEDDVIDPSSLCKFRRMRLKDVNLLDMLIGKTVAIAIEKGIIKSGTIIVDATHTASRSNPYAPVDILKQRSKLLRKAVYIIDEDRKGTLPQKNEDDNLEHEMEYAEILINHLASDPFISEIPAVKEKMNLLEETVDDIKDHYNTSKDREARVGHKSTDDAFFGYKTHIAMSPERIIVAATVTSGEKGDGPELDNLVSKSRDNGVNVNVVVGDAAYSGKENIQMAAEENIELVAKLNPCISQGFRKEEDKFDYNKDAGMFVCPAGHMAIRKARQGKKGEPTNQVMTYYFDVEKCKTCAIREGCYKAGAKTKSYSVSIKSDEHQSQMKFQKTERFKLLSKERYKIEAKNSELKNVLGYDRALSYGLSCMEMQGAMAIFAANLRRIVKIQG